MLMFGAVVPGPASRQHTVEDGVRKNVYWRQQPNERSTRGVDNAEESSEKLTNKGQKSQKAIIARQDQKAWRLHVAGQHVPTLAKQEHLITNDH